MNENRLIFGDNLEVMREDVPDESVGNTPNTLAFPIPSHTLRSLPASINSGLRGGLLLWWTVWSRTESRDGMAELTAWDGSRSARAGSLTSFLRSKAALPIPDTSKPSTAHVNRPEADLGIFTCFRDRVTNGMRNAAVNAGRFMDLPKIQIYTPEDSFEGKQPRMPRAA